MRVGDQCEHFIRRICLAKRNCLELNASFIFTSFTLTFTFTYPFTTRDAGAPQVTPQPVSSIFLCSQLPSGSWRTLGLSIPWCCLPHFHCLSCLLPPFTVPCQVVLARPDEREACSYRCSLRLSTMVRRCSCGPIACRVLARTPSLVAWSLY